MGFDHIIVGNSALGLSSAYRILLRDENARIAVVGPKARTGAATTAAGAMLGVYGELSEDHTSNVYTQTHFEMAYDAGHMWPQFVDDLNKEIPENLHTNIHPNGTYIVVNSRGSYDHDVTSFNAMIKALKEKDEPYDEVQSGDIPGFNPEDDSLPHRAIYIPGEKSINPAAVLGALDAFLQQSGRVDFIDEKASTLMVDSESNVTGVELNDGRILEGGTVVVAAGVGSQKLVDSVPALDGRVPLLYAGDGTSFTMSQGTLHPTQRIEHVIRTPNRAGACGIHVVPQAGDQFYIGAGNMLEENVLTGASAFSARWVLGGAMNEINKRIMDARILSVNQGNRPISVDGFPMLGPSDSVKGLWMLTGTGRDGFHCSPLISKWLVDDMFGDKVEKEGGVPHAFDIFRPERPIIETVTYEESIDRGALEFKRALHETGGKLSTGNDVPFPEWLRNDIRSIMEDKLQSTRALSTAMILPILRRSTNGAVLRNYLASMEKAFAPVAKKIAS